MLKIKQHEAIKKLTISINNISENLTMKKLSDELFYSLATLLVVAQRCKWNIIIKMLVILVSIALIITSIKAITKDNKQN